MPALDFADRKRSPKPSSSTPHAPHLASLAENSTGREAPPGMPLFLRRTAPLPTRTGIPQKGGAALPASFQPSDAVLEREADRVAEHVDASTSHVPRSVAAHATEDLPASPSLQAEENFLQAEWWEGSGSRGSLPLPCAGPNHFGVSLGCGQPLEPSTQAFFAARLGYDFRSVRIHTGLSASQVANSAGALAVTSGDNILFGEGQYAPETVSGRKLLAHELTHVLQQGVRSATSSSSDTPEGKAGFTGHLQRKPAPGAVDANTAPMAFIDDQLKLRFNDPEDPALLVRVHQLQEAFHRLNALEAKQLLGRLQGRESGDALAQNFQRLATASRNKLRAILVARLPSAIEGKTLGIMDAGGVAPVGIPLIATLEVVPSTEEAGMFDGYADLGEAREVAIRRATVTAIVFDTMRQRPRVFETGVPSVSEASSVHVATRESGPDYQLLEWQNLQSGEVPDPVERKARLEEAGKLRAAYLRKYGYQMSFGIGTGPTSAADLQRQNDLRAVQNAYQALLEEAAPFARGRFNASLELDERQNGGAATHISTADPDLINFNVFDGYKLGFQGVLNPAEESLNVPGAHTRMSMVDIFQQGAGISYQPFVALTQDALSGEIGETRGVILHEETHRTHVERTLALREEWLAEGTALLFKDWLLEKVKRRQISPVEAALASEQAERSPSGWHFNTELLAEVESFQAIYHAIPLGSGAALERLPQMDRMWAHSASEVQELALRKLRHYYWQMLPAAYRAAFDQYVVDKVVSGSPPSEFYLRLSEFATGP